MVSVAKDGSGRDVITAVALWARIGESPPPGMLLSWLDPSIFTPLLRFSNMMMLIVFRTNFEAARSVLQQC